MNTGLTTRAVVRLLLPAPPMLEAALGYEGGAAFVAFHRRDSDSGLSCMDSSGSVCVIPDPSGWIAFAGHERVAPYLAPFDFGDQGRGAQHWLLLAREERALYAGPVAAIRGALGSGDPNNALPLSFEEQFANFARAIRLWDEAKASGHLDMLMGRQGAAIAELQRWLAQDR